MAIGLLFAACSLSADVVIIDFGDPLSSFWHLPATFLGNCHDALHHQYDAERASLMGAIWRRRRFGQFDPACDFAPRQQPAA